jgi:fructose-1-phosphate kinase PfkB-like protein
MSMLGLTDTGSPSSAACRRVGGTSVSFKGGLPYRTVPIAGSIRTNVSMIEADGTSSKINEPGPTVTSEEVAELINTVGAGDAFLAGYLAAESNGLPPAARLSWGVALGWDSGAAPGHAAFPGR